MDDELIQVKGVTKRFGKNVVLDNISLNIPEKQVTGIIGASGEGKSTILKLLIGYYKPTKGEVLYLRRNILHDLGEVRKRFGFATEDGSFYETLTVKENIYHFGKLSKIPRKELNERAKEILDFVGLNHALKTQAKNLSVGMKKRLDVACSLLTKPEVLIMDEPTADLDPLLRDHMLQLIRKICDQGTTVILTTQLLEEMDKVCDKIAILFNRKIVEEGTPRKIRAKYDAKDLNEVFTKIFSKRPKVADEIKKEKKEEKKKVERKEEKKEEEDKFEKFASQGKKEVEKKEDKSDKK